MRLRGLATFECVSANVIQLKKTIMVVGRTGEEHMDDVTSAIAAFVTGSSLKTMSAAQIDAAVMHLVDALGCAIAATATPPYGVVRDVAAQTPTLRGSSVIGSKTFCSPEMAAFANSCLVRALDFNDTYNSRSGGHPSVLFPGILAVVEERGLSSAALLQGIHVASEVYGWLCDSISLPGYPRSWVRARMPSRMRLPSAFLQVCTWASSALARSPPGRAVRKDTQS
jgi:MmgE/PrpD N-terminal domain